MENWIKYHAEPRTLFLAWQAPDHFKDRFRWAVGIVTKAGGIPTLRYLAKESEFPSFNQGRSHSSMLLLGYQGYPGLRIDSAHRDVLGVFLRRLPPRNRSDFPEYITQFRIADAKRLSDFSLLSATEAKLPSDGFSLVDPLDAEIEQCDLMLEIAGYRYYEKDLIRPLYRGQSVLVEPEPENPHDRHAVRFQVSGQKIGNVNRLQAATFGKWLRERCVTATIERLNGNADRPRAFVFITVRKY